MTQEIKQRIEQIKRGEVPQGYKSTKVGIVPMEWDETHLRSKFERLKRKNAESNTNVLTISAQHGLINQNDFFNKEVASENKSNYFLLKHGEFAYNKSYSNGYPYGAIKKLVYYDKGVVSPLYICFFANKANKHPEFYEHYFEAGYLNKEIWAFAQEGARNHGLLNIAVEDFFNSYILSPSTAEQQKIAEILTTQDKVIELKEKLLAEKQKQKKWLMQNLLTGKKRLSGFAGKWTKRHIGYYLEQQIEKQTPSEEIPLMAFTAKGGIEDKGERYDRSFLVKSDSKLYKRTYLYDFIYSSNNLDVGSIGLNLYGDAVISDVYEIFKINNTAIPIIVDGIIRMPRNISKMIQFRQGVIYGQYRIHADDFLDIYIEVPLLPEQTAIANILSTADREIDLMKKDIAAEKQKKKALMQLLLTGIVRVNV